MHHTAPPPPAHAGGGVRAVRMLLPAFVVSALFATLLLHGCCTSRDVASDSFTVTLSSGGGVSGMRTGFSIDEAGSVRYHRSMHDTHESSDILGVIGPDERASIARALRDCDVTSLSLTDTGNMTTEFDGRLDGRFFRLRWPGVDTDRDAVHPSVVRAWTAVTTALLPYREKVMTGATTMHRDEQR